MTLSNPQIEFTNPFESRDHNKTSKVEAVANALMPDMTDSGFNAIFKDQVCQFVANDNLPKVEIADKNIELLKDRYGMMDRDHFKESWMKAVDSVYGTGPLGALEFGFDRFLGSKPPEERFREATDKIDKLFQHDLNRLMKDALGSIDPAVRKEARGLLQFIDKTEGLQLPVRWRSSSVRQVRETLKAIEKKGN